MSEPFHRQLQAALGDGYRLDRELGGGGMSRVFLADETRFGRRVVIKVLTPELTVGVSAERFEREVLLAATLQEPHIVPVLTAGDADGMPYYTMPFVDGLSLRQRMLEGAVPIELAVSVLHNVVAALAYAHARGIVHRDIKPENVLLSGNTAVVTDFGIAKALSDARDGAEGASTLTATGTSIGSPAYMAPEQAAGDAVDGRADLYAWGVVAYELLAGAHPFAEHASAQKMIVAHLTVRPKALSAVNAAVSAPLSDLVMRCLEKNPGDRPPSSENVEATLGAIMRGNTASISQPRWRSRKRVALIASAGVIVAVAGAYALTPAEVKAAIRTLATRGEPDYRVRRAVVTPLVNETGDARLSALGPMASDAITAALSQLNSLETVDARTVAATANVVEQIPRPFRGGSTPRAIAAETGAGVLVMGSYFLVGDSVRFRARIVNSASGAVVQSLPTVSAATKSPTTALPALAQRVASALRSAADSDYFVSANSFSSTTSMAAYDLVRAAFTAGLRGDSTALSLTRRALAIDSLYGSAIMLLPAVAQNFQRYALADSAIARALRLRDRMTPLEQANLDEFVAVRDGDLAAYMRATTREFNSAPNSDLTKSSLAYTLLTARQPRRALEILRGMQPDRGILLGDASYWLFLSYAHAQQGQLKEALTAAREGDKRVPGSSSMRTEAAVLALLGDTAGANEALRRISSRFAWGLPRFAASSAALLANSDSPDAEAMSKRFAEGWLGRGAANGTLAFPIGRLGLLVITERWSPLLALADSLRALKDMDTLNVSARIRIDAARAIANARLGHRDAALAIDSAIAAIGNRRWLQGAVPLNRARIAAHLGDSARAVELLDDALQHMVLLNPEGVGTLGSDPYLLPLRRYAPFRALLKPAATDGVR
jgi:tRNA A-37 threonylcarbamoyl transferase component Bud32/TolB-like protein